MEAADQAVAVIAVFTTCLKGFKILTDNLSAPHGTEALWQQMRIQAARLRIWGEQFGIDENTTEAVYSSRSAVRTYENLRDYLKNWPKAGDEMLTALHGIVEFLVHRRKLEERFGLLLIKQGPSYHDKDTVELWQGVSKLRPMSKARLEKINAALVNMNDNRWSIEIHGFEGFIVRTRVLIDDLYSVCPPHAREMMSRALASEILADLNDVSLLLHLNKAASEEARDLTGIAKTTYQSTYKMLAKAAKLRARRNLDRFLSGRILNKPRELRAEDYQTVSTKVWEGKSSRLAVGTYPTNLYLVEYKSYDLPGASRHAAEKWINTLAELLCAEDKPQEYMLPNCIGYFKDRRERRYGFVFEPPKHILRIPATPHQKDLHLRKPTTLMELLKKEDDPLDLGTRFRLAKQLVAGVCIIHASGFLHRNIRASSVIFWPEETADPEGGPSKSRRKALDQPCLMGWGYQMPEEIDPSVMYTPGAVALAPPLDFYQHPYKAKNPHTPYVRAFDIYSLGLVLLEIGLWQPLYTFTDGVDMLYNDHLPDRFKAHIEHNFMSDLRSTSGPIYQKVVERCLNAWTPGAESEPEIYKKLCWEIMGKLMACNA